jgi:FkbM family methyltransferase
LNGSKNISLQNTGLGEKEEQVKLYIVEESNPGMNRVLTNVADNNFASETINIKRLDDFIEIEKLPAVNVIKIDVEGFEFNVLKGAERILTQFRPILFIELNDAHLVENGASAAKLLSFLFDKGYNIFAAESMHQINRGDNLYKPHFDIICLPHGK